MDVTDRASIAETQKVLEQKEGRLHILVNKCVVSLFEIVVDIVFIGVDSAGQIGPGSDTKAVEGQDTENLGRLLFSQDPESWVKLYQVNTFSIFFVTAAFLGLLDKGSRETEGYTSCVINITSISGITRLSQDHVRHPSILARSKVLRLSKYAYGSSKAAAAHLTKVFATDLALKRIPVRVNAIAPGPFESEMTGTYYDRHLNGILKFV